MLFSVPVIILVIALQLDARVPVGGPLSAAELSEIESMLLENAPRSTYSVSQQNISLNADQMNLLLRYAISTANLKGHWAAQLTLANDTVNTHASIGFDLAGVPVFLNIEGQFSSNGNKLQLSKLSLGGLPMPNMLIALLIGRVESDINSSSLALTDINSLIGNVESLVVNPQRMQVTLQWDPVLMNTLADQTQQLFVSDEDRMRVAHYYQLIAEIITATPLDIRAISLNSLLVPLFTEARSRTNLGSNAVAENRAAFQALAIYVNGEEIERFVGNSISRSVTDAKAIEVRLLRRQDLAKHLASIASITASAGADLAAMLSTTKEAYDARYRSGFSFSDLTANTVGVNLASFGTKNSETAKRLQTRIIKVKAESEYMPTIGNNRDGISESDFAELYQDRTSEQYLERMNQINELVFNSPLFADLLNP
jgi:uncharacterized protein YpmS|tara:strand:- start:10707 stop:11987 length:1281 start_codon:yes stop_codon:yes gene_type:complete